MNRSSMGYTGAVCLFLMTVLLGCLAGRPSEPSRFYTLTPLDAAKPAARMDAGRQCVAIGIGPVEIPEYLNRAQIVTRLTDNELKVSEFNRWAEPLNENLTRVLAENLSDLCAKPVMIFPWRTPVRVDFRVEISVIRFDGSLGKEVTLIVLWAIFGEGGDRLHVAKRSVYMEPPADTTYAALVAAKSRAVSRLSRDIAASIDAVIKQEDKG